MFGPIEVRTTNKRLIYLNGQCQGGMWMRGMEPSDVSPVDYVGGWFMALASHPQASALMLGLGSGSGPIAALTNFPDAVMTVVEIDPAMIDLAVRAFPQLDELQNSGRLEIINADASEFLTDCGPYDVCLYDIYAGGPEVLEHALPAACACADAVYVNAIDDENATSLSRLIELMVSLGRPQPDVYRVHDGHGMANWIVVSDPDMDVQLVDAFEPYADRAENLPVSMSRRAYQRLLSQRVDFGSASKT